jgi:hypothetical protein
MDINWNNAEREWDRLVREQSPDAELPNNKPESNPYDLPGCLCIGSMLSWAGLSFWSADPWLIIAAISTLTSLWCIGQKESLSDRPDSKNPERPPDNKPPSDDADSP